MPDRSLTVAPSVDGFGPVASEGRGRPRLRSDAEILELALRAFATQGFDAVSVRALNAALGLSHGTINQRFGSKERLYYAAVDHGFGPFLAEIEAHQAAELAHLEEVDDLDLLRTLIHGFLLAARQRPELGRLMSQEGTESTDRLDHIVRTVIAPMVTGPKALLDRLQGEGRIRPVTLRTLFFLATHGAETPFTLGALSQAFDAYDGPLDPEAHARTVTDLLMAGLVLPERATQDDPLSGQVTAGGSRRGAARSRGRG